MVWKCAKTVMTQSTRNAQDPRRTMMVGTAPCPSARLAAMVQSMNAENAYEKPMTFVYAPTPNDVPAETTGEGAAVKLDWKGWRIGFDLGASDEKIAVVKDGALALKADGEPLLSAEYVWDPKPQTDIQYHYDKINYALNEGLKAIHSVEPGAKVWCLNGVL